LLSIHFDSLSLGGGINERSAVHRTLASAVFSPMLDKPQTCNSFFNCTGVFQMWSLIAGAGLGAVLGGILTILITIFVEYLRSPSLELSLGDHPRHFSYPDTAPAQLSRALTVRLTNKPLRGPRWMTRAPALQCRGTVTFHHLDGQNIFGRSMEGRWCNSVEPAAIGAEGELERIGAPDERIKLRIMDPARIVAKSRIDVYPGESELLDIAVRLNDEQACYGWNNETYFIPTPWRNPVWKLERGRYLVSVSVVSSGQTCWNLFRLINDVPADDFRLEKARSEDYEQFRAQRA
jgi:hypothetical protein